MAAGSKYSLSPLIFQALSLFKAIYHLGNALLLFAKRTGNNKPQLLVSPLYLFLSHFSLNVNT